MRNSFVDFSCNFGRCMKNLPWQLPVRLLTPMYSTRNSRCFTKTWVRLQLNVAYMACMDMYRISDHPSKAVPVHVGIIGILEGKERKGPKKYSRNLWAKLPGDAKRVHTKR